MRTHAFLLLNLTCFVVVCVARPSARQRCVARPSVLSPASSLTTPHIHASPASPTQSIINNSFLLQSCCFVPIALRACEPVRRSSSIRPHSQLWRTRGCIHLHLIHYTHSMCGNAAYPRKQRQECCLCCETHARLFKSAEAGRSHARGHTSRDSLALQTLLSSSTDTIMSLRSVSTLLCDSACAVVVFRMCRCLLSGGTASWAHLAVFHRRVTCPQAHSRIPMSM
jgi:hypothetical protein